MHEFLSARERGDEATERAFFEGLLLRNGVYKTTAAHRMDELLPLLVEEVRAAGLTRVRVLDVACSSGVTTVELHEALAAHVPVETVGTDLTMDATLFEWPGDERLLVDSTGHPIQVELGNWASPWRFGPRDSFYKPRLVRLARAVLARARSGPGVPVRLLGSKALRCPGAQFVEEDVTRPTVEGLFSLIRVANVLNRDYFTAEQLGHMGRALRARLADGGILLLLRTVDGQHHGTIFRRAGESLVVARRIGSGSEIESLLIEDIGVRP